MAILGFVTGQAGRDQDASDEAQTDALNTLYNDVGQETEWRWVVDPATGEMVQRKVSPYGYGESRVGHTNADPRDVQAQMSALNQLQRAASGQPDAAEYARRGQEDARLGSMYAGQAGAIQQTGQEMGQGSAYSAALAQGGAQAQNVAGADLATQRSMGDRMRALQAMQEAAQLSSERRGQGAHERGVQASAVDAFNAQVTANNRGAVERDINRQNERTRAIGDAYMGNAIRHENQANASQQAGANTAGSLARAGSAASSRDQEDSGSNTYSSWKS